MIDLMSGWKIDGWTLFGLLGNVAFTSRFLVQWVASERAGKPVIPMLFWYLSMTGAMVMLIYAIVRRDIPVVLGFAFTLIPYTRNVMLARRHARLNTPPVVVD